MQRQGFLYNYSIDMVDSLILKKKNWTKDKPRALIFIGQGKKEKKIIFQATSTQRWR